MKFFIRPKEGNFNGISTELFCEVLGKERTPRTCDYFKERGNETIHNVGSPNMVAYDHIVVAAANTATGGNHNLIDTASMGRIVARQHIASHHARLVIAHHNGSLSASTSSLSNIMLRLPLLCPPRNELEMLLNKSLAFEQKVMPKFYNSPLGKEKHIQKFWEMVDKKKVFCHVDTDKLFQNVSSWEQVLNERLAISKWEINIEEPTLTQGTNI